MSGAIPLLPRVPSRLGKRSKLFYAPVIDVVKFLWRQSGRYIVETFNSVYTFQSFYHNCLSCLIESDLKATYKHEYLLTYILCYNDLRNSPQ